jgi:hypothetical protein
MDRSVANLIGTLYVDVDSNLDTSTYSGKGRNFSKILRPLDLKKRCVYSVETIYHNHSKTISFVVVFGSPLVAFYIEKIVSSVIILPRIGKFSPKRERERDTHKLMSWLIEVSP